MVKNIYIKSVCDNGKLIDGIIFSVNNGKANIYNDSIVIELTDDGNVTIPSGNYELLEIETDCGDFKIDLPNCFFNEVKLKSDCGDMNVNTNYNVISFNTDCGEYINRNVKKKPKRSKVKVNNKVKSIIMDVDPKRLIKKVKGERYE